MLGLLLVYWLLGLAYVDRAPPVHEDEPWIASTGWNLAVRGRLASSMFAGVDGMDRTYYEFMPLYPVVQSIVFGGAGVGLFQARWVSLMAGALTLALTMALGQRLWGDTIGMLAGLLLLTLCTGAGTLYLPTGILFLDVNRLARYDALVPVFGMTALHLFYSGTRHTAARWYVLAGVASGLAGLAHVYGAFWSFALLLLALFEPRRWRTLGAVALGAFVPWLGYAIFVMRDFSSWEAQLRWNAGRVELASPAWYVQNVLTEGNRYDIGRLLGTSPGAWLASFGLVLALLALIWQSRGLHARAARLVVVPFLAQLALFALLLNKRQNYALTLMPLAALSLAWGLIQLAREIQVPRARQLVRLAVALLVLAVVVETGTRWLYFYPAAANALPYAAIAHRLREAVPPDTRVLGLHSSWFGFEDTDYRDILAWGDPTRDARVERDRVEQFLDSFDPQAVLLDPRLRAYLDSASDEPLPATLLDWMKRHRMRPITQVNATEGTYTLYAPQ